MNRHLDIQPEPADLIDDDLDVEVRELRGRPIVKGAAKRPLHAAKEGLAWPAPSAFLSLAAARKPPSEPLVDAARVATGAIPIRWSRIASIR